MWPALKMTGLGYQVPSRNYSGRGVLALAAAALLAQFLTAPPAGAANTPCGSYNNYFAGTETAYNGIVRGAKATIENWYPALCSTSSMSNAWVMVVGVKQSSTILLYAQAGYTRFGTNYTDVADPDAPSGLHKFAQRAKTCFPSCSNGVNWVSWYSASAPTEPLTYVAKRLASDGQVHMYTNGVDVLQTDYEIADYWNMNQVAAQYYSETVNAGSDVMGTGGDTALFENLAYYKSDGTANVPQSLTDFATIPRHHGVSYPTTGGNKDMVTWTDPL